MIVILHSVADGFRIGRPFLSVPSRTAETQRFNPASEEVRDASLTRLLAESGAKEEFKFESNVSRVMDIIINSLYSNTDVFIRELISNAADACDKKRFLALTDSSIDAEKLGIRVYASRDANTLTIYTKSHVQIHLVQKNENVNSLQIIVHNNNN